jgi:hypothetical protein
MRTLIAVTTLAALAPLAAADRSTAPTARPPAAPTRAASAPPPAAPPAPVLAAIDPQTVPDACKPLMKSARSPNLPVAVPARISLASCMADRAVSSLSLCDCADSIQALDAAVAPAIAILDDAIAAGDPAAQVIGEHTEGQLYAGLSIRLHATVPRVNPGASPEEVALHDVRTETLEAQLAPWREAANTAFQAVIEVAKAHPDVARNPVVATAVRDSEQRLAADVASR